MAERITSYSQLVKLLINCFSEGIDVAQAAGYKENPIVPGMPKWRTIKMAKKLPLFLTTLLTKGRLKVNLLNSMAQDILIYHRGNNELESLNGYFLELAESFGVEVPYSKCIYELCKE